MHLPITIVRLLLLVLATAQAGFASSELPKVGGTAVNVDEWTFYQQQSRDGALAAIARSRVIQQMAVEQGILERVLSYRQLVEALHMENSRRKEMKATGQVFYGPVQFRQDVWFTVWHEQIIRAMEREAGQAEVEKAIQGRVDILLSGETKFSEFGTNPQALDKG